MRKKKKRTGSKTRINLRKKMLKTSKLIMRYIR